MFLYMPVLIILLNYSCKNETNDQVNNIKFNSTQTNKSDSLVVSVELKNNQFTFIEISNDTFFDDRSLYFSNNTGKDTIIVKKIFKNYHSLEMTYHTLWIDQGIRSKYDHYYLIDNSKNRVDFTFNKGDIILKNKDNIIVNDSLYSDYKNLISKIDNKTTPQHNTLKYELDSLYSIYKNRSSKEHSLLKSNLNDSFYYFALQQLEPFNEKTTIYLKEIENPIASEPLKMLLYSYVQNRIDTLKFDNLNYYNYNSEFINLLAYGVYSYIKQNKNNRDFSIQYKWLKTTQIYEKFHTKIDQEILVINKKDFAKRIANLKLLDSSFNEIPFNKIIQLNESDYYLLDFWATWCAPCISGINNIKALDIPKNISVINLSVDKLNDKSKWKSKSKELKIKHSFLLKNVNFNHDFLKMVEMNSIPRYIIIDRNFNLIKNDFYHPKENLFLKELLIISNKK